MKWIFSEYFNMLVHKSDAIRLDLPHCISLVRCLSSCQTVGCNRTSSWLRPDLFH